MRWLQSLQAFSDFTIAPASADASFRRYFRVTTATGSYVVMDAPPAHEDCLPFIRMTGLLEKQGLNVPHIHARDLEQGFLLLDDLGSRQYLKALDSASVRPLYQAALQALRIMQETSTALVPLYDEDLLQAEMDLFEEWFLNQHLKIHLSSPQQAVWQELRGVLVDNALSQPAVFVHRDYHSRNLMVTTKNNPGIIDYQDAVRGPVTYDLVSLLKDCYIEWPEQLVTAFALEFKTMLGDKHDMTAIDDALFLRWFDLMGMQRHLKAIGIFARLYHRDGKDGYLADIPRTLGYLTQIAGNYPQTRAFGELIHELALQEKISA